MAGGEGREDRKAAAPIRPCVPNSCAIIISPDQGLGKLRLTWYLDQAKVTVNLEMSGAGTKRSAKVHRYPTVNRTEKRQLWTDGCGSRPIEVWLRENKFSNSSEDHGNAT
jgi:hypothetical protein